MACFCKQSDFGKAVAIDMDTRWMNYAEANQILSIGRPAEQFF